jgi:hypothetical protein
MRFIQLSFTLGSVSSIIIKSGETSVESSMIGILVNHFGPDSPLPNIFGDHHSVVCKVSH